jgi:hypothetical protein
LGGVSSIVTPFNRRVRVQSHDILYKVFRDILYTLRAGSTGPERL